MTTTDIYHGQHWNEGEGLTYPDLQDQQDAMFARIVDQLITGLGMPDSPPAGPSNQPDQLNLGQVSATDISTAYAYCLAPGAAYLKQGSTNVKVKIMPGTLFQKVAAIDGATPKMIPYTFTGAEEVTIAAGSGVSGARIDIIQMQLSIVDGNSESRDFEDGTTHVVSTQTMNKKRRVQCTLSVKQGTPTAITIPAFPDPDSGYVMVGAVRVGSAWTGGFNFGEKDELPVSSEAHIYDMRMPFKVRAYTVPAALFDRSRTAATVNAQGNLATASAIAWCPEGRGGKLVGIAVQSQALTGVNGINIVRARDWTNTAGYTIENIYTSVGSAMVGAGDSNRPLTWHQWGNGSYAGPSGVTSQPSGPSSLYCDPVWANGCKGGPGVEIYQTGGSSGPFKHYMLGVQVDGSAGKVGSVTFYVAEGL